MNIQQAMNAATTFELPHPDDLMSPIEVGVKLRCRKCGDKLTGRIVPYTPPHTNTPIYLDIQVDPCLRCERGNNTATTM